MATRKRTEDQRQHDLTRIADMRLRGYTHQQIGEALHLSRQQIAYDMAEINARWRESQLASISEAVARELDRLEAIEQEAWEAWRRSIGTMRRTTLSEGGKNGDQIDTTEWTEAGDPRFLDVVLRCVDRRARLMGLEPKEPQGAGVVVNVQNNECNVSINDRRTELLDIIAAASQRAGSGASQAIIDTTTDPQ